MATPTKSKKKKRTPAQIAATKRMLEGLARSKRAKGKKKKAKASKAKPKRTSPAQPSPGSLISTKALAKGSRFGGWKSNTQGDMREINLPSNARIVTRGKRAVIVYTDK